MKYTSFISSTAILSVVAAAPTATISNFWHTLTPSGSFPSGAHSDFSGSFGISIKTVRNDTASTIAPESAQLSGTSIATPAAQISDGQIQHKSSVVATATASQASPVAQISDGQIQHQTEAAPTASAIAQICDGQIQHQTEAAPTASAVAQIGDGQIQHQTEAAPTASAVAQISDGQIQHQTEAAPTPTASAIAQISDGQIQHQTASAIPSASGASQIADGQIQNRAAALPKFCAAPNTLTMTLKDSELRDSHGRVGAIVANHQFQFDGPPPQAGSIYAAGWSIYEGVLALGSNTKFYQCQSGDFYNLYDEPLGDYCEPVQLEILEFIDC